ncbi:MAG: RluA family pseudouridine synthase [Sorangiineae bacterium]|nr:RluA family pseudouridine synthase [Polyangiaceae bacterium]MEB2322821.1 RluA family pseudouridine synthase [Sorangiineae bacterium]
MARPRFTDLTRELEPGPARPLGELLRELYPGASWGAVRELARTGKVSVGGELCTEPRELIPGGARVSVKMAAPGPRAARAAGVLLEYADGEVVVVHKPAGLSTVPFDERERDTLDRRVRAALERREHRRRDALGVVHRIDKETSGLVVFARTLAAKRHLEQQFRLHTVHRRYLALAHGRLASQTFSSRLVADRGDGLRGSTTNPRLGRTATTHVRALEPLEGATLVECRLETGRTHQIRIHLSEAGHPLLGERVYQRGYPGALIAAPRLMLHAAELGFIHPRTGAELRFSAPPPEDLLGLRSALKAAPGAR